MNLENRSAPFCLRFGPVAVPDEHCRGFGHACGGDLGPGPQLNWTRRGGMGLADLLPQRRHRHLNPGLVAS